MKPLSSKTNRYFSGKSLFYNPEIMNGKLTPEEQFLKKQQKRLKDRLVKLLVQRDLDKLHGLNIRNINFQIEDVKKRIIKNKSCRERPLAESTSEPAGFIKENKMSTTPEDLLAEQDAMIGRYRKKILDRFGFDIVEDFGNDLYEWTEQNFEDWITEQLQMEFNEGVGL